MNHDSYWSCFQQNQAMLWSKVPVNRDSWFCLGGSPSRARPVLLLENYHPGRTPRLTPKSQQAHVGAVIPNFIPTSGRARRVYVIMLFAVRARRCSSQTPSLSTGPNFRAHGYNLTRRKEVERSLKFELYFLLCWKDWKDDSMIQIGFETALWRSKRRLVKLRSKLPCYKCLAELAFILSLIERLSYEELIQLYSNINRLIILSSSSQY